MTSFDTFVFAHFKFQDEKIIGGGETVINQQVERLTAHGYKVLLVGGSGDPKIPGATLVPDPLFDSTGEEIDPIQRRLDKGDRSVLPEFELLVSRTVEQLKKAIPKGSTVVIHNILTVTKNLALTVAYRRLYESGHIGRLIVWTHDLAWRDLVMSKQLHRGYPWKVLQLPLENAQYVCVSEIIYSQLEERFQKTGIQYSATYINNGADPAEIHKWEPIILSFIQAIERRCGSLDKIKIILYMPMRLTRRKTVERAIYTMYAFNQLPEFAGKVIFMITGAIGPHNPGNVKYKQELLDLTKELGVEDQVFFLEDVYHNDLGKEGRIPREVVIDLLKLCDALLLTTSREGFGVPIIEGGMVNKPIFATRLKVFEKMVGNLIDYIPSWKNYEKVANFIGRRLQQNKQYKLSLLIRQKYILDTIFEEEVLPLLTGKSQ